LISRWRLEDSFSSQQSRTLIQPSSSQTT
jgi:hypothetical protein